MRLEEFLSADPESLSPPLGDQVDQSAADESEASSLPAGPPTPGGWTLPVERFSATSLNMLSVCPRQFQQRYLLGRKEPPTQQQIVGNSFHSTFEYNFKHKMGTGSDLPIEELTDYLSDEAFPDAIERAGEDIVWSNKQDALLSGHKMVTAYRRDLAPSVLPVQVEEYFSINLDGLPVPLEGRIDVITETRVIDLKSSKRKHHKLKGSWQTQARVYQLAQPRDAQFHITTTKGETLPPLEVRYSIRGFYKMEQWVKNLAWTANHYYNTYGAEEDWPATGVTHDWRCDWCGYRKDCPIWVR